ncbi:hypothetical protein SESBI_31213 [Sesbania bispinosa]|nr:hypothetical protein SESBI_31213 [Sesbania bispinosa]
MTNLGRKAILMYWGNYCTYFYVYDRGVDGNHHNIYWSVRTNGVVHSWDNNNWNKMNGWFDYNCRWAWMLHFRN